jgi:hypothetical protein
MALEPPRQITWSEYMNGRDRAYARELTLEMARNARTTIVVVNRVLEAMAATGSSSPACTWRAAGGRRR